MHTLFVREHNRLCDLIKAARPGWNDEEIYQNTRRILIAEYQSIVYGGYLPVVLGSQNMEGLELSEFGSEYNPQLNPAMTNEFATAAYLKCMIIYANFNCNFSTILLNIIFLLKMLKYGRI